MVGGLCRGAAAWGCAGAQRVAVQGRSAGLCRGTTWGCAGVQQRGAAQGCSGAGLRREAVWGGAVVGGLCRGVAWGCAGAQRGAAQGRSNVGLRRGAAAWGCAEQLCGAAQWWGGCVGATPLRRPTQLLCAAPRRCAPAQPHAAAPLRSPTLRPCAAPRCGPPCAAPRCAPAQPRTAPLYCPTLRPYTAPQCGAAQGRRSVGLRRGAAAWGCAGVQQRGAA